MPISKLYYMQTELCLQRTLSDTQTHNVFQTVVDNVSGDCIHTICYIYTNGNTQTNTVQCHYTGHALLDISTCM